MKKGPAYRDDIAGRTRRWSLTVSEAKRDLRHFHQHTRSGCKAVAKIILFLLSAK